MKMLFCFNTFSRIVHEGEHDDKDHEQQYEVRDSHNGGACTSLTVWRKSLLLSCNGFTVIDSKGNLIFRVDNYTGRPQEIVLMDASGKSVLTMHRRKKLGMMASSWLVYEGEVGEDCGRERRCSSTSKRPIFSIRKHTCNILNWNPQHVLAYIYSNASDKRYAYVIEGSYKHRSCKVLDEFRKVVAETRKKEAINGGVGGVTFGAEVFQLIVYPGFEPGVAMALVLLLDQMFS
ncbi:hypothetical protein FNV43_RR09343 [Rhamnella rubrinervis]|uniref:Protein LURP-one-related 17 n=1 Tax=Rhamnella rubrinervis TaxID=2594499 RepID=A0A8K0HAB1_9ROSA|nr:hypothetical protein FNV43_RR09343 [Rhamnella rubrinervis]